MIDQRVAIVSGAAGGIGAPIAERLAADGFVVAGCDLEPQPACALGVELDVRDAPAVRAFVQRVAAELGHPDVVVTAAGVQRTGASEAVADEDWAFVLDVNLTGTWNVIRAVLPGMVERGRGRIVTISSEIGLAGLAGYAAYAASKGGVIALTKTLARELAPRGICVNSVAPGPIEAGLLLGEAAYSDEWLAANVPIGRFGQPHEVAACVALLAGDEGGYFVGQVLSPNRGDGHLNRAFRAERHGFDHIPESERRMTLAETAYFWVGTNANLFFLSVGVVAFELGLSVTEALVAVVLGTSLFALVGIASIAGVRAGLPTLTFTRAVFGPRGNVPNGVLTWIALVAFEAINSIFAVYALLALMSELGWSSAGDREKVVATLLVLAASGGIAVYGHATMIYVQRLFRGGADGRAGPRARVLRRRGRLVGVRAWIAMLLGVGVCLLTIDAPILEGPVSHALAGADLTWALGPLTSALAYWALTAGRAP